MVKIHRKIKNKGEKEEIAAQQHFLLFPQFFLLSQRQLLAFRLQNASVKICPKQEICEYLFTEDSPTIPRFRVQKMNEAGKQEVDDWPT